MIVQGKIYFAHLVTPDTSSGEYASGKYDCTIGHLSKESVKTLKEAGLVVTACQKDEDDAGYRGMFFKPKSTKKPRVVDMSKAAIPDEVISTIGNGSTVNVIVNAWGTGKKKGAILEAVQVVNLIPYTGREDFDGPSAPTEDDDESPF